MSDRIVNQLLAQIDGVNVLNILLVIGLTNRKDMLDEALLQPGQLEVQIEIGLPDQASSCQILKVSIGEQQWHCMWHKQQSLLS